VTLVLQLDHATPVRLHRLRHLAGSVFCKWHSFACTGAGVPVHDYARGHGGNRADR